MERRTGPKKQKSDEEERPSGMMRDVAQDMYPIIFSFLDAKTHSSFGRANTKLNEVSFKPNSWKKEVSGKFIQNQQFRDTIPPSYIVDHMYVYNTSQSNILTDQLDKGVLFKSIDTSYVGMSIDQMQHLRKMHTLKVFSVGNCSAMEPGWTQYLPDIETLSLSNCDSLTKEEMGQLGTINSLRTLSIDLYGGPDPGKMTAFAVANRGLTTFTLRNSKFFDLAEMASIDTLQILSVIGAGAQINAEAIEKISNMKRLRKLELTHGTNINATALEQVGKIKQLEVLVLRSCWNVDAQGLQHLGELPRLRILNLRDCARVDGDGLQYLQSLEQLDLSFCSKIDADGLRRLVQLPKLRIVNLKSCAAVDEAALRVLVPLQNLTVYVERAKLQMAMRVLGSGRAMRARA